MKTVLVTGGSGEIGTLLVNALTKGQCRVVVADINKPKFNFSSHNIVYEPLDITNGLKVKQLFTKYSFTDVFHLAAILSTSGERDPMLAHRVNADATANLLNICILQNRKIKFFFPSSIAAYGRDQTISTCTVNESEHLYPITIYGITKLYCENFGIYCEKYFQLLSPSSHLLDFRALRFPGLISTDTLPSGGTTDYAPEMIHAAAQSKFYKCFVRPNTTLPFMAMPDAVEAILSLIKVPKKNLSRNVYNVGSFSVNAKQIEKQVKKAYPKAKISYKINKARQKIVDSWPTDVDDSAARTDWGWKPKYNFNKTFSEYLIPNISKKYQSK